MGWRIEVLIYNKETHKPEWKPIRPTGSATPYEFATFIEAKQIRDICYPLEIDEVGVRLRNA